MFQIKFEGFNNLQDQFQKAAVSGIRDSLTKSVGNVKCPIHGSYSQLVISGNTLGNLNIKVSGCCDELIKIVRSKLK